LVVAGGAAGDDGGLPPWRLKPMLQGMLSVWIVMLNLQARLMGTGTGLQRDCPAGVSHPGGRACKYRVHLQERGPASGAVAGVSVAQLTTPLNGLPFLMNTTLTLRSWGL
jgi:hypothetical protein